MISARIIGIIYGKFELETCEIASSNHESNSESFEGNTSLHAAVGSTVPPSEQLLGGLNTLTPALDPVTLLVVANPLFYEQLHKFIMETINSILHDPFASRAEQSSQQEKLNTQVD
ncbi:UNVERIFIED_CONTAM: hypothetical protein Slati_0110100 [Sesamum latifolium]|uniref:Uncharacterized protein n=1 Tax=Sesamum latifolium TaxID=2727402 RepID=A0AAW2Y9S4_9LAMI